MRKPRDFVDDYRRKGYPDDRIRIIASMRPEPLRSEVLKILEEDPVTSEAAAASTSSKAKPSIHDAPTELAAPVSAEAAPRRKASGRKKPTAAKPPLPDALETLQKERAVIETELKEAQKEIKRLKATATQKAKSKNGPADVEALHKELHQMREKQRKLKEQNTKSTARIEELESALQQKGSVVTKMEQSREELEAALAKEHAACKSALARSAELAKDIEEHAEQLGQLELFEQQLTEANARSEQLQAMEQAHLERIAELEADADNRETNTAELRRQIESNEQAVSDLEEKLTLRDSELESLRAHFDIEAADLKKRAEQEMWMVQRRLNRMRRITALGAAGAACVVLLLGIGLIKTLGTSSERADRIAQLLNGQPADTMTGHSPSGGVDVLPADYSLPADRVELEPRVPRTPLLSVDVGTEDLEIEAPQPPTVTETSESGARVEYYVVKQNDKLWNISKDFLGDGIRWREIARENSISITNPQIKPGMKLRITIPAEN